MASPSSHRNTSPRPLGEAEVELWNDFVEAHPESSICHLAEWRSVFQRAYGKSCHYLLLRTEQGLAAVLPLVHMRGPLSRNRLVSLPFLDLGGILADSTDSALAMKSAALELARRVGAAGLDLRGRDSAGPASPEVKRYRLLLTLPDTREDLWNAIGPKVRNQIRKSEKSELSTAAAGHDELPAFYRVFGRNMRDLGSPVHSRRFFREILAAFGGRARIYLTRHARDGVVGAALALSYRGGAVVPWASSLRSHRSMCPNHSLYWGILTDAVDAGATVFDFGRSTAGTGTFHFKKQWGARPQPLRWAFLSAHGEREEERYLDPRRNASLSRLWARLPLALANLLGPPIRRQLPN